MHISSGRWVRGFVLALTTAVLWGVLPVAMKELLKGMDPYTVTWYRFLVSGLLLLGYLSLKGRLPNLKTFNKKIGCLLALAIISMLSNYIFYLLGLMLLPPGTTQLVMQIAHILSIIGGVIIFKESFNLVQVCAVVILVVGFMLFFNQHINELLTSLGSYTIGILLLLVSSVALSSYTLTQKQLLAHWKSEHVLVIIYLMNSFILFAVSTPLQIMQLSTLQVCLLIFSCLNTLVAYNAFAEALAHWEASKVAATISIAPLITFITVTICSALWPYYVTADTLNLLAYLGAIIVVTGSALITLSPVVMKWLKERRKIKL